MAERLNKRHQECVREKIRASQLVNRLEDHILGDLELTSTQVTAALGLLKKCVPDLRATEHSGPGGGAIKIDKIERAVIDGNPENTDS